MTKYRVIESRTTRHVGTVEANTEREAIELAKKGQWKYEGILPHNESNDQWSAWKYDEVLDACSVSTLLKIEKIERLKE